MNEVELDIDFLQKLNKMGIRIYSTTDGINGMVARKIAKRANRCVH